MSEHFIGDCGNKRHPIHLTEHWRQFLNPHADKFKEKYSIELENFLEEVFVIYMVYLFEIENNFTTGLKYNDNDYKYNITDISVIKNIIDTLNPNLSKTNKDITSLANIMSFSIDPPENIIKDFSYSASEYLEIFNEYKNNFFKKKDISNTIIDLSGLISNDMVINNLNNEMFKLKKPFIKLSSGKYILDKLFVSNYLERYIIHKIYTNPEEFNRIHSKYFENYINEFFRNLFPLAKTYCSYYYKDNRNGKRVNIEIDIIVILEKTLLILEIKSGRLVFNSYGKKDNIYDKAQSIQLKNIIDIINQNGEITLKNINNKSDILTIKRCDFNIIIPILVTQDTQSDMATQNRYDALSYSIDDLRIFRDIFVTSSEMLDFFISHYKFNLKLNKKTKILGDVIDIMEYYLSGNLPENLEEINNIGCFVLDTGNNEIINQFLFKKLFGQDTDNIRLELPLNIIKILDYLELKKPKYYLTISLYLLQLRSLCINIFEKTIQECLVKKVSCCPSAIDTTAIVFYFFTEDLYVLHCHNKPEIKNVLKKNSLEKIKSKNHECNFQFDVIIYIDKDVNIKNIEIFDYPIN